MSSWSRVCLLPLFVALWACSAPDREAQTDAESAPPSLTPAPLQEEWAVEWWMPRHKEKLALRDTDPELVFLGDSITQGWEDAGAEVFEEAFGQWRTLNLGFSGDRTENVIWRLEHGEVEGIDPELVVLMIGTNNTGHRMDPPDEVAAGITEIVDQLRDRLPGAEVLLLAIFPRGETVDDSERQNNRATNRLIRPLGEREGVHYASVNSVFTDEEGRLDSELMPDLLHPNAEGYRLLADELKPMVEGLMEQN